MSDDDLHFNVADYVVFALVLAISAAIGLFYAFTGGKQRTVDEFLMANRNMNWFPVAASLLASFMSGITILGTPGEVYSYGTIYVWLIFSYPFTVWFSAHVYLPVYFNLKLTSVYEMLPSVVDMRFNKIVRLVAVVIYIVKMLLYMGMVLYAPATAFMQVTGLNLWMSIFSVGIVCTVYTTLKLYSGRPVCVKTELPDFFRPKRTFGFILCKTLYVAGGMKAVLWTDTFQIFIMYAGIIAVIIQGCINEGGGAAVWETARRSGRLDFYDPVKLFDVDPRTRHTIWTQVVGGIFVWSFIYAANQAQIQRALTLPDVKSIQKAYWLNVPGLSLFAVLCSFCGLIIYSHFKLCDPLTTGLVSGKDQLYPLYAIKTLGKLPGVPGLVVASVFSGALSTVSSGVNSLAAVSLKDLVLVVRPNLTEKQATWTSKILAIIYGSVSIGIAAIAKELGSGILSAALAVFGILGGPILGLFSLGLFFPTANSWGALVGFCVGVVWNTWLGVSQLVNKPYIYMYPNSTLGCNMTVGFTMAGIPASEYTYDPATFDLSAHHRTGVEALYDISYQWLAAIGCTVVIVLGLLVSLCTGNNRNNPVDKRLLTPFFHQWCCCLPIAVRNVVGFGIDPPSQIEIAEKDTEMGHLDNSYDLDNGYEKSTSDLVDEKQ